MLASENKMLRFMKWSNYYVILFFAAIFFTSCSDDTGKEKKNSPTTSESNNSLATNSNTAEQKKPDIAVQGLKGKVQVMSELYYTAGGSKKLSSKNIFKYDENGNQVELTNYNPDG